MKLSNFLLSIVAMFTLGIAIGASNYLVPQAPTSVISIPAEEGVAGGGFTIRVPSIISSKQSVLLQMAYDIAKHDGHKYPQLLQGILLQETRAGTVSGYKVAGQEYGLKPNERYYGVTQIKLSAARDVLSHYPQMKHEFDFSTLTDEEIIAKLIENDKFNLSIASKYLLILHLYGYDTMKALAMAYNKGAGGAAGQDADSNPYAQGVMAYIQKLPLRKS